jgi:hypothetical protein
MLNVLIMLAPNPRKNPSRPSFFHVLSKTARITFFSFLLGPAVRDGLLGDDEDACIRVLTLYRRARDEAHGWCSFDYS